MEQDRIEDAIEKLLQSVDRPGDFCVHGRLFAPMPRLEVEGSGALAFPVPEAQIRALIRAAERAPYGKGTKTLVDRSVRDCWQIEPGRVRLAGAAWRKTFAGILGSAAAGLGCAADRLDAQLHKLLIYERGGFFAPHHDTEKADGMVATLSISLPAAGVGGELVVRHRDRESTIDMTAAEPSELTFAAFYADCTHEVRPLTEGHRLSLVFNLCLRAGDTDTRREAPDYTAEVDRLAGRLAEWGRSRDATDKLVWLLEHEYSEAGLSFDALKNTDAAVARVLARAAERAACELRAAIVHIEEYGTPAYEDYAWDEAGMYADDDIRLEEVDDRRQWLDGWVDPGGGQPPFGEIELRSEELLPRGALDGVPPDEQEVHEASGNAGVSVERAYRRAAFVVWPRSKAMAILAGGDVAGAVAWVAADLDRNAGAGGRGQVRERTAQLIDAWPSGPYDRDAEGRARMLRLLSATGDEAQAEGFLRTVVLARYDGSENEALAVVVDMIGPSAARRFLIDLTAAHLRKRPADILALLRCLDETRDDASGAVWDRALRAAVRALLQALPTALPPPRERRTNVPSLQRLARLSDEAVDDIIDGNETGFDAGKRPPRFGDDAVHDLFTLALRRGSAAEAETAAGAVASQPAAVTPDRTLPAALGRLHAEEGAAGSGAFALLWRHAAGFLLARSARPPEEPSDWVIGANVGCRCEHCRRLRDFCKDPAAHTARFPLRKELRAHLHQTIDRRGLDIEHVTERRGRPFTLVCTKTRATYRRRLAEYAEDVACMRGLIESSPSEAHAARCAPDLARLRGAVAEAAAAPEPSEPR